MSVRDALAAVLERLGQVDLRLVLVAVMLQVLNHALRATAWRGVLVAAYPAERVPIVGIGTAYATGVALNAYMPARGGDVAKAVLVRARIPGSSVPTIVASMAVISLFDAVVGATIIAMAFLLGLVPQLSPPSMPALLDFVWGHAALIVPAASALFALAWLAARRFSGRLILLVERIRLGGAILQTPARWVRTVAVAQLGAWGCRVGVISASLAAFGIEATLGTALVVLVLGGLSTFVPVPGGAGSQQALVALALQATASTAAAVSFSLSMQMSVTALNTLIGVVAAMVMFRTLRPGAAVRSGLALVRAGG